jgi:DNA repair protein RecN (Recombination protein N)
MLQQLSIKNYAIIDTLDIRFSDKMNIITGETGAGKSILLGALSLILGERAETGMLRNKEEKCIIEAHFDLSRIDIRPIFEAEELDFAVDTIIRREILPNGKSRAFVNDTPATLKALKEITSRLVDLHSQHETLAIGESDYQLFLIDTVADNTSLLLEYKKVFSDRQSKHSLLKDLEQQQILADREADYVHFQLQELNEVPLESLHQNDLEAEQNTLNHAEEIRLKLVQAKDLLNNEEGGVHQALYQITNILRPISHLLPDLTSLYERIESCLIELGDIDTEIEKLGSNTNYDADRMEEISQLLTTLYKLQKKHGVNDLQALVNRREMLAAQSYSYDHIEQDIQRTQKEISAFTKQLDSLGEQLFERRANVFKAIETQVTETLKKVGMPDAQLKIVQERLAAQTYSDTGIASVQYLFSANKGTPLKEIKKVASGGELSRLMLSLKSMLAASVSLPTMIFDEIDTGISGNIAAKTGEILNDMSKAHQLICITHLPQIAAKGQKHFHIYKTTTDHTTYTKVKELNATERLQEIAAMLAGDNITEGALTNARELLATP